MINKKTDKHRFGVIVRSRADVLRNNINEPYVLISIVRPGDDPVRFESEYKKDQCDLVFHDINFIDTENMYTAITKQDATNILKFVKKHWEDKLIVIHCLAGISRSAGVAAALLKIYTGSDEKIFNNPCYVPNTLVYKTIIEAYYKDKNG
jgi:Predicted protein tyrosine phosphatase